MSLLETRGNLSFGGFGGAFWGGGMDFFWFFGCLVVFLFLFLFFLSVCRLMSVKHASAYCTFVLIPIYSALKLDL